MNTTKQTGIFKSDAILTERFINYTDKEGYDKKAEKASSWRWENSQRLESDKEFIVHQFADHLKRYGFRNEEEYRRFLSNFNTIVEIGAGEGRCVDWYLKYSNATVYALEISDSVFYLREKYKNEARVIVIKADAMHHPFLDNTIDLVSCEQSISNAPDAESIFNSLCKALKSNGKFIISLFAEKSVIREKMDVIIRDSIAKLPPEQILSVSSAFSDLGKLLHETNVKVKVPSEFTEFGTLAGKEMALQSFFYYAILKCFYNEKFTPQKSAEFNHDWYCYPECKKYNVAQVSRWFINNGLSIDFLDANEANINFRGNKH